jgi:hypothetical protein
VAIRFQSFFTAAQMRVPSAVKNKLIVAREISSVREQISIQRSAARGIILSFRNLSECEPHGIAIRCRHEVRET